jgi:hypothetical protein
MLHTKSRTPEMWWRAHRNAVTPGLEAYLMSEASARSIYEFQVSVVPGLAQTERYARAVLVQCCPMLSPQALEERLRLRMNRQWHILERASQPHIEYIIEEAVLYRQIGGKQVLREQLQHLRHLAKQPFCSVYVVPFVAGQLAPHFYNSGCTMFNAYESDGSCVAYVETAFNGELYASRELELLHYRSVIELSRGAAYSGEKADALIRQALARLESDENIFYD